MERGQLLSQTESQSVASNAGENFAAQEQKDTTKKSERTLGALKGMFVMSPDFDEPLEEFKDYM